jgi:hypothetical protein
MDNIYILSIDPANKSLAISFFSYNNNYRDNIKTEIKKIQPNKLKLKNIDNILNNVINILYMDVIDLFPDIKVSEINLIDRTNLFKYNIQQVNNKLDKFIEELHITKIVVCIEYQPVYNHKSSIIFNQLIYEYSYNNLYNIQIIHPTLKNKIFFHPSLTHNEIIKSCSSAYQSNKKHTKENFLYLIKSFNLENRIKHIKKKNLDDIADTIFQGLAYVLYIRP